MTNRPWAHLRAALPASIFFCAALGCGDTNAPNPASGGGPAGGGSSSAGTSHAGASGASGAAATFDCSSSAEPGELVQVPAGEFSMGCNGELDADCLDDELPLHSVSLAMFEIDRTEVTQGQYTACVMADVCTPPSCAWDCEKNDHAAGCVTWGQADGYCRWAEKRLPTEAEWEKAARGDSSQKYPWGDAEPDCTRANMAGCGAAALPVGSMAAGASPYGALDMAGNLVEMISDWYDATYYASSPGSDPQGPASGTRYGGRGGGFKSDATWQRTSKRDWYDTTDAAPSLGFRCAR